METNHISNVIIVTTLQGRTKLALITSKLFTCKNINATSVKQVLAQRSSSMITRGKNMAGGLSVTFVVQFLQAKGDAITTLGDNIVLTTTLTTTTTVIRPEIMRLSRPLWILDLEQPQGHGILTTPRPLSSSIRPLTEGASLLLPARQPLSPGTWRHLPRGT